MYKRVILIAVVLSFIIFNAGCKNKGDGGESDGQKIKYVLTLNLNGGMLSESNVVEFYAGERINLPEPAREGYKFGGWFRNEDCTGARYYYLDGKYTYSDIELWAKWIKEDDADSGAKKFKITYFLNGGHFPDGVSAESEYLSGERKVLPVPEMQGYKFSGWYENGDFSGSPVVEIGEECSGDKKFYALWEKIPEGQTEEFTITYVLYGGEFGADENVPRSYRKGDVISLPVPRRQNYVFGGWFGNALFEGNAIAGIYGNDFGNKIFYAKWTEISEGHKIKVKDYGGHKESAYVEIEPAEDSAEEYSVRYREKKRPDWKDIDKELIRFSRGLVRADILGIKAGSYDIEVKTNGDALTLYDITVAAHDRSGEALSGSKTDGFGGYNFDGTLKQGATVVYVTEENKNSVKAEIGGREYSGIANILSVAAFKASPLVVRVVGQVSAATWNYLEYDPSNVYNGRLLTGTIGQEDLLKGGFNSLNTENYSVLEGLASKIIYDEGQFDSYWNMCEVENAGEITIEGVGTDAVIFQWGFSFRNCRSVEVRNLTFSDFPEYACRFTNSEKVWVHGNNFGEGKNYWNVSPDALKARGEGDLELAGVLYATSQDNRFSKERNSISRR